MAFDADDNEIYQSLKDIKTQRTWLIAEVRVLDEVLKKEDNRSYLLARKKWLEAKLKEIKPAFTELKFQLNCMAECERRQKEKDDEWEQWYYEQRAKNSN